MITNDGINISQPLNIDTFSASQQIVKINSIVDDFLTLNNYVTFIFMLSSLKIIK